MHSFELLLRYNTLSVSHRVLLDITQSYDRAAHACHRIVRPQCLLSES